MARKLRTPKGISLNDLAQGLKNQGLDVPENVQKLLNEQEAAKAPKKVDPKKIPKPPVKKVAPEKKAPVQNPQTPSANPLGITSFEENPNPEPQAPTPAPTSQPSANPLGISSFEEAPAPQPPAVAARPAPANSSDTQTIDGNTYQLMAVNKKGDKRWRMKDAEQPEEEKSHRGRHILLKTIFGAKLGRKIEKSLSHPYTPGSASGILQQGKKRGGTTNSEDIKIIKQDVKEIKELLIREPKPEGSKMKMPKGVKRVLLTTLFGRRKGLSLLHHGEMKAKSTATKELPKPKERKEPYIRIPEAKVPQAADHQMRAERGLSPETPIPEIRSVESSKLEKDKTPLQDRSSLSLGTVAGNSQDQLSAEQTKEEIERQAEQKRFEAKQDKILEAIDKLRKKDHDSGGFLKGIGRLLATMLGPVWKILKTLGGALEVGLKALTKLSTKALDALGNMGKSILGTLGRILSGLGMGAVVGAVGAVAATGGMLYGINKMFTSAQPNQMAKLPQDKLAKFGLRSLKDKPHEEDKVWELNGQAMKYEDLPEKYQKLVDANTGDLRGGRAKDAQAWVQQHLSDYPTAKGSESAATGPNVGVIDRSAGATKPAPKPSPAVNIPAMSAENASMKGEANSMPIIVVKGGDTTHVTPAPQTSDSDKPIIVQARNSESSLDRLNASLFDHPVGYYGWQDQ